MKTIKSTQVILFLFSLVFLLSCSKQNLSTKDIANLQQNEYSQNAGLAATGSFDVLTACNRVVYPQAFSGNKTFSFYIPLNMRYGIPVADLLSFQAADIDTFRFVAAGFLENSSQKPLYYIIRKKDNKYLSYGMGGAQYTNLLNPQNSLNYQKWLVSKTAAETYHFILPNTNIYNDCSYLKIYLSNGLYRMGFSQPGSGEDIKIYMKENIVISKPPIFN